ncbi:hypothetical protein KDX21_06910 [Burkholderia cenocepacia]|uniref:surface-adhesin E family protein n=1 Tax=Burkholderia cenocepacia TaxID=95486 RepID=UPI001B902C47|nr:surface-adhesin E family protein [Burkholderia cenocepacia]MBR8350302.1 hypothetical protein [Burkholderia cenocepacia]
MKKKKILLGIAFLLCANAHASDWKHLGNGPNNEMMWVDDSSIRFSGGHAKAWFLENYTSPKPVAATYPQKFVSSMKQLDLFDCDQGTLGIAQSIQTSYANGEGEVVLSSSLPPSAVQYEDVVPDSMGEAMLAYVCARRPSAPLKPKKSGAPAM